MPEFTYAQVAEHKTKKDLYLVVHDKVYDTTSFVDEHPGGEEVLLDVGGQDATEAFEDVGHSDEACAILEKLAVGDLKRLEGDKKPISNPAGVHTPTAANGGSSITTYILLIVGVIAAIGAYQYQQNKDN